MAAVVSPGEMQLDFWEASEPSREAGPTRGRTVPRLPATASGGVPAAAVSALERAGATCGRRRMVSGERTLEEHILGVWEELVAHRRVGCPVCGAARLGVTGGSAAGGACERCGTRLS